MDKIENQKILGRVPALVPAVTHIWSQNDTQVYVVYPKRHTYVKDPRA